MTNETSPIKAPESLRGPENPGDLSPDESRVVEMIANSFNPGDWGGGGGGDDKTKQKKKRINQKFGSVMNSIASSLE